MKKALIGLLVLLSFSALAAKKPNIVLIYTDDLGYGDISVNGATGVKTPNIDKLASQGLNFSDSHCSAATCTPSRVTLLTGEYAFRSRAHILRGDAPLKIRPGTTTLPGLLQKGGYKTAVVGKWHLGLGNGNVNWNKAVKPGPLEIGFDYSFLIPATGDRTPCVYVENHHVVDHDPTDPIFVNYHKRIDKFPSGKEIKKLLKHKWSHGHNQSVVNGVPRIGWMTGGIKARWVDEDMADVITHKANQFIERNKEKPFFLYFATHDIHVPRVPHSRFVGKSSMGPRGDAIVQMDWCVGEIMKKLDEHKLTNDTIFIFTSDNGPVLDDGYHDQANEKLGNHKPAGPYKAGKYSVFEGATRVPFIIRWPAKIKGNSKSAALHGQVDLARTLATVAGAQVPENAFVDSRNELNTLIGKNKVGRPHLIHEGGGVLSLRQGNWKFIPAGHGRVGLGPWKWQQLSKGGSLYDLSKDIGETTNIAEEHSEKLAEMKAILKKIKKQADL